MSLSEEFLNQIARETATATKELITTAGLRAGQILVVGCSSSEMVGQRIGKGSSMEAAGALVDTLMPILLKNGIFLAAQCCEHLNRAIIVEAEAVPNADIVNVVPQPKAGGSFATAAYHGLEHPVAVEEIKADAGLDIGATLIGMHLKKVAVPVRLQVKQIGQAPLTAARVRPKFIGGVRAIYDQTML